MNPEIAAILEPLIKKAVLEINKAAILNGVAPEDKARYDYQFEVAARNALLEEDVELVYIAVSRAFMHIDDVGHQPSTYSMGDIVQQQDISTTVGRDFYHLLTKG